MYLSYLDLARKAFLLTICQRDPGGHVARSYLEEKVYLTFAAQTVIELRNRLDIQNQDAFDAIYNQLCSTAPWQPVKVEDQRP